MNNDSRLRAIESQIKENRRLLLRILYLVDEAPGAINDGHRITADGVSFIPGTGRLDDIELGTRNNPEDEWTNHDIETTAYALKITSDHPTWGEVTTVFAYRNDSNGYYGGWCEIGDASDGGWPVTGNVLDVAELEQGGPQL